MFHRAAETSCEKFVQPNPVTSEAHHSTFDFALSAPSRARHVLPHQGLTCRRWSHVSRQRRTYMPLICGQYAMSAFFPPQSALSCDVP